MYTLGLLGEEALNYAGTLQAGQRGPLILMGAGMAASTDVYSHLPVSLLLQDTRRNSAPWEGAASFLGRAEHLLREM